MQATLIKMRTEAKETKALDISMPQDDIGKLADVCAFMEGLELSVIYVGSACLVNAADIVALDKLVRSSRAETLSLHMDSMVDAIMEPLFVEPSAFAGLKAFQMNACESDLSLGFYKRLFGALRGGPMEKLELFNPVMGRDTDAYYLALAEILPTLKKLKVLNMMEDEKIRYATAVAYLKALEQLPGLESLTFNAYVRPGKDGQNFERTIRELTRILPGMGVKTLRISLLWMPQRVLDALCEGLDKNESLELVEFIWNSDMVEEELHMRHDVLYDLAEANPTIVFASNRDKRMVDLRTMRQRGLYREEVARVHQRGDKTVDALVNARHPKPDGHARLDADDQVVESDDEGEPTDTEGEE